MSERQASTDHETEILGRITTMIGEEKALREGLKAGLIDQSFEHARLSDLEAELDRCGDLLRQRRARAAAGEDPDETRVRPASQVEHYLS
ncbi:DUF2630 family protein [Streptomyces sp. NPDC008125]|uniref:DUF2630 family protein n=1 Tax=Streptomyces sp. NPDC008125 TaxID=3364811 RepID=UPI0036ED26C9